MFDVLFEQKLEVEAQAQKQKLKMTKGRISVLVVHNDDDEWRFEKSLSSSISIRCIQVNWT